MKYSAFLFALSVLSITAVDAQQESSKPEIVALKHIVAGLKPGSTLFDSRIVSSIPSPSGTPVAMHTMHQSANFANAIYAEPGTLASAVTCDSVRRTCEMNVQNVVSVGLARGSVDSVEVLVLSYVKTETRQRYAYEWRQYSVVLKRRGSSWIVVKSTIIAQS